MLQKSAKFNIQNASERVTHPFVVLGAVVVDRRTAHSHTQTESLYRRTHKEIV